MKISDIDFERKTIHIRQSKYKKDRSVPLSDYMAKGLKTYLEVEKPHIWLFNGENSDGRSSSKGLNRIMREALKKPVIKIKESTKERIVRLTGFNYYLCPVCKTGFIHTIKILPKIRAPVNVLYEIKILSY